MLGAMLGAMLGYAEFGSLRAHRTSSRLWYQELGPSKMCACFGCIERPQLCFINQLSCNTWN